MKMSRQVEGGIESVERETRKKEVSHVLDGECDEGRAESI
jgi:hypothetical protein